MQPDSHLRPRAHVHAREFDGELVILDLDGGVYYGLDPLGTTVWQGICDGKTIAEVARNVLGEYDVTEEQLLSDLLDLVKDWVGKGLMEERPA